MRIARSRLALSRLAFSRLALSRLASRSALLLTLVWPLVACSADDPDEGERLVVSAAASLTDAFTEIESEFERLHGDVEVVLNFAGSSALREQILGGSPVDVFASADLSNMAVVVDAGETIGEPEVFAENRLQIAVPAGNPAGVEGVADFANENLLVGLCAQGVPCGDLARELLQRAGVSPAIDSNEPNVRALLTKIAAGELDAGITYVTDVIAAGLAVEGLAIPDRLNLVAEYSIVAVAGGDNADGVAAFIDFMLSEEGRAIMRDHGFSAP